MLAAGFDEAFVGIGCRSGLPKLAIYSIPKAVEILEARGMDREEAREFLYDHAHSTDVGACTPIWVEEMTLQELRVMASSGQSDQVH
jgi:hypothetical protein